MTTVIKSFTKIIYITLLLLMTESIFLSAQTFVPPNDTRVIFTGAFFNKVSDSEVIFRRHSDTFLALIDWKESLASDNNANTNTGITINFSTDATEISLHFRMLPGANAWNLYASYYIDGDNIDIVKQKRDDLTAAGDSSFVYTISSTSAGIHSYTIVLSTFSTVAFEGITLTGGSENLENFTLPEKPVYVAYGNSITHGRGQDVGDQTYPWILATQMEWELYNIAVGGSKTSVPMAEMLKNEVPEQIDFMSILIGYNDAVWYAKDTSYYRETLISFIDAVRAGHPETTIFVLGQTYTLTTENIDGDALDFDDWRKVQKYVVDSLTSNGDKLIYFINGDELTSYSSLNNPPDDPVHLGITGASDFGISLADTITRILNESTGIFTSGNRPSSATVYPNPAKDYIIVKTEDNNEPFDINLLDMQGKVIKSYSYSNSSTTSIELNVPTGFYLIEVIFKNRKETFKVLKL